MDTVYMKNRFKLIYRVPTETIFVWIELNRSGWSNETFIHPTISVVIL